MKEYLEHIIILYVRDKHVELKLAPDHLGLAVFDVFKGQQMTETFLQKKIFAPYMS